MREVGQINSTLCKNITVFHYNHRYLIKFESGDYEQIYKVREGAHVNGIGDVKRLVDENFVRAVMGRFKQMNIDFVHALAGLEDEDEDEFDTIL